MCVFYFFFTLLNAASPVSRHQTRIICSGGLHAGQRRNFILIFRRLLCSLIFSLKREKIIIFTAIFIKYLSYITSVTTTLIEADCRLSVTPLITKRNEETKHNY